MRTLSYQGIIVLLLILTFILFPSGSASADVGPKPTLDFYFTYKTDQPLTIVSGELLACLDSACQTTEPLELFGAQHFACEAEFCSGMIYGSPEHMRLQIKFSDNQTRLSNPFTHAGMQNIYQVVVRQEDLIVRRNIMRSSNTSWGQFLIFFVAFQFPWPALALCLSLLAGMLIIEHRNRSEQLPFKQALISYLVVWLITGIGLVAGSFATWALPVTVFIEAGVAIWYDRYYWPKKRTIIKNHGDTISFKEYTQQNRPPWLPLLTAVALINLITQPMLWAIVNTTAYVYPSIAAAISWQMLLFELFVCLVEAGLLRIFQWRHFEFKDALQLSFFMNVSSFLIGLLLIL
jgi:hypothetical protein